jgi:hypothetical protein
MTNDTYPTTIAAASDDAGRWANLVALMPWGCLGPRCSAAQSSVLVSWPRLVSLGSDWSTPIDVSFTATSQLRDCPPRASTPSSRRQR